MSRLQRPLALITAAIIGGAVPGILLGILLGVWENGSANSDCVTGADEWCELSADIGAVMLGMIAGVFVYLGAGSTIIFRSRPSGERIGHVLGHVGSVVLLLPLTMVAITVLS